MNTGLFLILANLLIISVGLLLLGSELVWLRAHRKYSTWKPASGIVTKIVSLSISPSNFHFYPVVEFQTKTGKIISVEPGLGFYPAKHRQGQTVSVWYEERNPNNAILDLVADKWTVLLALGIFGAFAIIIGGIILSLIL